MDVPPHLPAAARILAVALLVAATAAGRPASAQPPPAPQSPPQVYQLTLEPAPEIKNGRLAAVQGTAGAAGVKLLVGGLSILQPAAVMLIAQRPSDDLRIELTKFTAGAPVRSGSTKGEGVSTFEFRTEGDVQITVTSPDGPKPFRIVAWAGDEVTPDLPSIFTPVKTATTQAPAPAAPAGEGGPRTVLWVIAGALALCVGLLAIIAFRRGRS
jgi:hypothetical protein